MTKRIIRLPEVKLKTGISKTTIYYLMGKSLFPNNIVLGKMSVGWLEADIDRWIEQRSQGLKWHDKA